jgi:hypothetical protein
VDVKNHEIGKALMKAGPGCNLEAPNPKLRNLVSSLLISLGELDELVTGLHEVLEPILAPSLPKPPASDESVTPSALERSGAVFLPPDPTDSPLCAKLRDSLDLLQAEKDRIRMLTSYIEV